MPELIDAGYIYIAKPPLYKIKQGNQERYIEKESELEEILLGDKLEKVEVLDRNGKRFSLTETRWQRFTRLLKQYEAGPRRCAPASATTRSGSWRSRRCSTRAP